MKKVIALILFLLNLSVLGQSFEQGLRITIVKETKQGYKPLSNAGIELTINDSIKLNVVTNADGVIEKLPTEVGKFKIKIKYTSCWTKEISGIVVSKGKTAYLNLSLICEDYLNSLSKKEKKKLGYK